MLQPRYTMDGPAPTPYSQFTAQDVAYIQQNSKLAPPPLLTQNLSMYSMSDLQSVNAQQHIPTPISATVPAPASASPSSSGSPFYGSFSDSQSGIMNSNGGSPYPPSSASPGAYMAGVGNSLGLQGTGTAFSEPDTLLRLREEAERADRSEAKQESQEELDADGSESLRDGLKPRGARRRIWTHALEKYLFTPHEMCVSFFHKPAHFGTRIPNLPPLVLRYKFESRLPLHLFSPSMALSDVPCR